MATLLPKITHTEGAAHPGSAFLYGIGDCTLLLQYADPEGDLEFVVFKMPIQNYKLKIIN